MRTPKTSKRFRRHYAKLNKSGDKKIQKLNDLMQKLTYGEVLDPIHKDHALKGKWKGYRDCHVEGDWVLIYKIQRNPNGMEVITFEATDNHSNLFK